jgi:hypothetical protein
MTEGYGLHRGFPLHWTVAETHMTASGGAWMEIVLCNFCSLASCADGAPPFGLMLGASGNLYGTTSVSATDSGVVFQLSPLSLGSEPRTETILYAFCPVTGRIANPKSVESSRRIS